MTYVMHNLSKRELEMLEDIERDLVIEYDANPDLTDAKVSFAMGYAKVAVKQAYGFAKKEKVSAEADIQGILNNCVITGKKWIDAYDDIDPREFCRLLDKVKRSIDRHQVDGLRGYYNFVRKYVK